MNSVWPMLVWAQLRNQPLRALVSLLTLGFGVALFAAIHLVNAAALGEFEQAARRLAGEADVIVRGPRGGYPEALYATLARRPEVREASPVLEVDVALAGVHEPLRVLGFDTFRAARLQPQLAADIAGDYLGLFGANELWLSEAAARELGVAREGRVTVLAGGTQRELTVRGILPAARYSGRLGIMDIASAQWTLDRVGLVSRVDLQLKPGIDVDAFRATLARELPAGLQVSTPDIEAARAASLTRAYRVNLAMLALVSILTGALLLFATQSLSVLRRRSSLALLRALGVTRGALRNALLAEGLVLGAVGSLLGIALGIALAAGLLALFRGSLGLDSPELFAATLVPAPLPLLGFFALGTLAAGLGAWLPAQEAARRAPARALKAGDAELAVGSANVLPAALVLLAAAVLLALLPAVRGISVFGYASIAALLAGGLLLVPAVTARLVALAPASGRPALDVGLAQIKGGVGQLSVSLAAVIVSFALMVAMAIMVHSFRVSFDQWLGDALPADVQLRVARGSETRVLDEAQQRALAGVDGVARVVFRRQRQVLLGPGIEPVTVIAQDMAIDAAEDAPGGLALVASVPVPPGAPPRAFISEGMGDLYALRAGMTLKLPLKTAGTSSEREFFIAGVFRDYGRGGASAVFIDRATYVRETGDTAATDAAVWLVPRSDPEQMQERIRRVLGDDGTLEMRRTTEIRELSMRAFDRAFAVTYALEAVAVLIGLVGIACAGAATALARRGEFGMLRHLGMLRRQIVAMLAAEGLLVSLLAALYGLVLGGAISLVLVHVVNRQSFHWSIDLAVPVPQLALFAAALVIAATVTNVISARAALGTSALRAVREDW
jgi:putative ABC transport system permease protein